MPILNHSKILEIHSKAIEYDLAKPSFRTILLTGLPLSYISKLPNDPAPGNQLFLDLSTMNADEVIANNIVPLELWLRNASYWQSDFPKRQGFFRALADEVLKKAFSSFSADPSGTRISDEFKNEKIIFSNDLLMFDFLIKAQEAGRSVVRIAIDEQRLDNNQVYQSFGTGWLIANNLVMTNYHVIRSTRNPDDEIDLKHLTEQVKIQFDFDSKDHRTVDHLVKKVVTYDKELDFAILELNGDITDRQPLRIRFRNEPYYDENTHVNIIQHPSGGPKQISIRNNNIARTSNNEIAYFSDTQPGSSGSPVCNDMWEVIALHKASTMSFGKFTYQGKETSWINIGTKLSVILNHIGDTMPELLTRIKSAQA